MTPQPAPAKLPGGNIQPPPPGTLTWNGADPDDSLRKVQLHAEDVAQAAIAWYWRNTRWKRLLSRFIQASALMLAALSGIVPIVATIITNARKVPVPFDSGLVASLLVGLAAALLGLDKAFGASTGWARYVLTATTIRKALAEFRLDWTALTAVSSPLAPEQINALLQLAKEFVTSVEGLVLQETKDWIGEFQTNMAQLEKDVKAQLDTLNAKVEKAQQATAMLAKAGSLELTVPNADKADQLAFDVTLSPPTGSLPPERVTNTKVWAKTSVPPGHCKVVLSAAIGGKPATAQSIVEIKPGEITKATVPLQLPL
jgi:hypothetical protein